MQIRNVNNRVQIKYTKRILIQNSLFLYKIIRVFHYYLYIEKPFKNEPFPNLKLE